MVLTLRRTASATELLITATVSTAIKLPPSQLHVERQAPLSHVFTLTMKGSLLFSAKEAVRRFLRMYQDSESGMYTSTTSRAIFAGSEVEVVKYVPAVEGTVHQQALPALSVASAGPVEMPVDEYTFRPRTSSTPYLGSSPPAPASTCRLVSLSMSSLGVVKIQPAVVKPVMSVQHAPAVALPFRKRPSLSACFSDKVICRALPESTLLPARSVAATSDRHVSIREESRRERPREQGTALRRSSSSLRVKSPVRASDEEDVFPRAALRKKKEGQRSEGAFSVLSEATKEAASRSDFSAAEPRSFRRQSSLWKEEEESGGLLSEGASSTGWSWLWGGEDSEEEIPRRKSRR